VEALRREGKDPVVSKRVPVVVKFQRLSKMQKYLVWIWEVY